MNDYLTGRSRFQLRHFIVFGRIFVEYYVSRETVQDIV